MLIHGTRVPSNWFPCASNPLPRHSRARLLASPTPPPSPTCPPFSGFIPSQKAVQKAPTAVVCTASQVNPADQAAAGRQWNLEPTPLKILPCIELSSIHINNTCTYPSNPSPCMSLFLPAHAFALKLSSSLYSQPTLPRSFSTSIFRCSPRSICGSS